MSQRAADTPTLKEALKQDRAQFEDCTPCRVVGTFIRSLNGLTNANRHLQAPRHSWDSVHSPTYQVIPRSAPMKLPYAPARAYSGCGADIWPSQGQAPLWWAWVSTGGSHNRHHTTTFAKGTARHQKSCRGLEKYVINNQNLFSSSTTSANNYR